MRGGWKAGYGLPFGDNACGGAGVFHQTCAAKDPSLGCVYVHKDRVKQCNYIGGNHIQDWGCYTDVSDNCEPKIQAGSVKSEDSRKDGKFVKQHNFELVFAQTPVVSATLTAKKADSAHVQIFDVTKSGFKYAVVEPTPFDGKHGAETINFVAAAPGTHNLTAGITMVAGSVSTANTVGRDIVFAVGDPASNTQTGVYETVTFPDGVFSEQPALLTGITSTNNAEMSEYVARQPWMVPAVTELAATGFKVSLDRCEATGGTITSPETVGYIALTPGHGRCEKTSCWNAKFSVQHAKTSGARMGWDEKDSTLEAVAFHEHFDNDNVIAIAGKSTRNGLDGGWMRIVEANRKEVKVVVDEDTTHDDERAHVSEDVGLFAFSEPFVF